MIEEYIKINNLSGLHARPASELVKLAKTFKSDAKIIFNNKQLNCKSLLNLLTGEVICGSEIKLEVCGMDEQICAVEIGQFLNSLEE